MSKKLKYITDDKINLEDLDVQGYLCDDMSIVKEKDKTYSKCKNNECIKNHPQFGYYQLYYLNQSQFLVTTPLMKCLFGIQKNGNQFSMSLQFTDLQEDSVMKQFYDFIENLQFYCMARIGLDETDADNFISQIKHDKKGKYDPNLSVKIPFHYNRFQTEIFSESSSDLNLFQIQGFTPMKCDIYVDKIWKMNDKFHMKWKCKAIQLL